ncbi:Divergent polysaccharide deacetylase [Pseudogemmobacter humi]|uniref:Divergent polysaccharide deacetylase n=2 Tax=Pseudogemmobacter humi TaxID=2483812 RepID=A0A3P5XV30_9RHOB|nr:Divergent polysaccharide deacetylase [Pseudogemmobacter humi]
MLAELLADERGLAEGEFVIIPAEPAPADLPAAPPEAAPGADQEDAQDAAPGAEEPAPAAPEPETGAAADEPARRIVAGGESSTLPATPSLGGRDTGVETGRLPRIGDEAAPAVAEPAGAPPRQAYARSFENPAEKPLFAVILIDDGSPDLDRAALAGLPFPVSFALDPQSPGAADHAATYRAAGQEVIMLATGLPQGAAASDVGVAFDAMARALPEAVAVMDLPARAFQADRPLASLVIPVIGDQGRGLVTWDAGLNAADQVARRAGLPAAVAFRDLDAEGEEAPVIRRYLDRAAFKAAQEGRVTVVGRTRPETIAALLEWSLEGRAGTVALAPVTAVLRAD